MTVASPVRIGGSFSRWGFSCTMPIIFPTLLTRCPLAGSRPTHFCAPFLTTAPPGELYADSYFLGRARIYTGGPESSHHSPSDERRWGSSRASPAVCREAATRNSPDREVGVCNAARDHEHFSCLRALPVVQRPPCQVRTQASISLMTVSGEVESSGARRTKSMSSTKRKLANTIVMALRALWIEVTCPHW